MKTKRRQNILISFAKCRDIIMVKILCNYNSIAIIFICLALRENKTETKQFNYFVKMQGYYNGYHTL